MDLSSLYQTNAQPIVCFQEDFLEIEGSTHHLTAADVLEVAFSRIRQEVSGGVHATLRIVREGQSRGLHPVVKQEAYRITREALLNAFRHSEASRIEVELEYAPTRLRIAVRDNGRGIAAGFFRSGRGGHRGLSGMRDLAERIGGELKLLSRVAAGTEVELSIPGHIAFLSQPNVRRFGWAQV